MPGEQRKVIAPDRKPRFFRRKWFLLIGAGLAATVLLLSLLLAKKWPFTSAKITAVLEKHFDRRVAVGKFTQTYFPPGFVAEDLRILDRNRNDLPPLAVARKVVLAASYLGFLDRRVARVDVAGLDLAIPPAGTAPIKPPPAYSRPTTFDLITVSGGSLTVLPNDPAAVHFQTRIKSLQLNNVSQNTPISFHATLLSEMPPCEIRTMGTLGPWNLAQPRRTPLSGSFRLDHADLSIWKDISGLLSSAGQFAGTLAQLQAHGSADVVGFQVARSTHKALMSTSFRAVIDEENGDVSIEQAQSRIGHTTLISSGEIAGGNGAKGKTVRLHLSVPEGTVEDLLRTATAQQTPSMTGQIALLANVEMPPGPGFLRRVHLTGDFGIGGSRMTNKKRQAVINHLGESSQGESKASQNQDMRSVLSAVKGHVAIRDGIATLTQVSFRFEGSDARVSGTYNLLNKNVDLQGILKTKGKLADTTKGWKAGLLTVISPLMRKDKITTVQFAITGTSAQPKFSFRLGHKRPI